MPEQLKNPSDTREILPANSEVAVEINENDVAITEVEAQEERSEAENELATLQQLLADAGSDMTEEERRDIQDKIDKLSQEIAGIDNQEDQPEEVPLTPETLTQEETEKIRGLYRACTDLHDSYLRLHSALNYLSDMQSRRSIAEDAETIRDNINGWQAALIDMPERVQDILRYPKNKKAILEELTSSVAILRTEIETEAERAMDWAGRIQDRLGDYDEVHTVSLAFRTLDENMQAAAAILRQVQEG